MAKKEDEKEEKMEYEYWLANVRGVSARKKCLLREYMKSAKAVYYIEETHLRSLTFLNEKECDALVQAKRQTGLKEETDKMLGKGIRFVPWCSAEYPKRLKELHDFPYALYVKGNLPDERRKKAALVGARKCTPYGEKYAVDFARSLAGHGVEIISGMARGIDGMGHRGALMGGGRTYAVLGCGADICYPKEHIGLCVDILEQGGGIISEYPPGTPPLPQHFPARNRIISGLSDVVLVMEAGRRSGSLITVDMALEQGRDVYALPGPVNSSLSDGCNRLIRQGAGILLTPQLLLEEWGMSEYGEMRGHREPDKKPDKNEKMLESPEKLVYSCLGLYPKSVDQVAEEAKIDIKSAMELLVSLELGGYIREVSKNRYIIA